MRAEADALFNSRTVRSAKTSEQTCGRSSFPTETSRTYLPTPVRNRKAVQYSVLSTPVCEPYPRWGCVTDSRTFRVTFRVFRATFRARFACFTPYTSHVSRTFRVFRITFRARFAPYSYTPTVPTGSDTVRQGPTIFQQSTHTIYDELMQFICSLKKAPHHLSTSCTLRRCVVVVAHRHNDFRSSSSWWSPFDFQYLKL